MARSKRDDGSDETGEQAGDPRQVSGSDPEAKSDAEQADSEVSDQVQEKVDQETEQGFRGIEVDPTPNENYTVEGVTSGAPTPETDPEQAEKARQAQADVATRT
jgi:hypothetical protein